MSHTCFSPNSCLQSQPPYSISQCQLLPKSPQECSPGSQTQMPMMDRSGTANDWSSLRQCICNIPDTGILPSMAKGAAITQFPPAVPQGDCRPSFTESFSGNISKYHFHGYIILNNTPSYRLKRYSLWLILKKQVVKGQQLMEKTMRQVGSGSWGLQSSKPEELNCANNPVSLEEDPKFQKDAAQPAFWLQPHETLSRWPS